MVEIKSLFGDQTCRSTLRCSIDVIKFFLLLSRYSKINIFKDEMKWVNKDPKGINQLTNSYYIIYQTKRKRLVCFGQSSPLLKGIP